MNEPEFQHLLHRYLRGLTTAEENRLLEQWYVQLGKGVEQKEPISLPEQTQLLEAMWQRVQARTQQPDETTAVPSAQLVPFWRSRPLRWAAAALLAFAAASGSLLPYLRPKSGPVATLRSPPHSSPAQNRGVAAAPSWTERINRSRHEQVIGLPDGSRVTLKPGSRLSYATGLPGTKREVKLSGEGFFEVSKNPARPFLVLTSQLVTTVLGTSFRVKAYAGSPSALVVVRTGRVAVQARRGAHLDATPDRPAEAGVLLLPNQQVLYSAVDKRLVKKGVINSPELASQAFTFANRPVAEVLTALATTYGVPIEFDRQSVANCTVTLHLNRESLYEKLDILCETIGASYDESDAGIHFHSTGCKRN